MLTTLDDHVLAAINLRAVFGALPKLVELVPEARQTLGLLDAEVTLTLVSPGEHVAYTFSPQGIRPGGGAKGPTLLFRSAAHVNRVVNGASQPIPVAGPKGIKFLTHIFTPLTDILASYLKPDPERLTDPTFVEASTLLTFEVVIAALVIVANADPSGQVSAEHMPDGTLDVEIGDEERFRIQVTGHKLQRVTTIDGDPSAALHFGNLTVAGGILSGQDSAMASLANGGLSMRGMIPLVDNTNRLLDRVGAYLGA